METFPEETLHCPAEFAAHLLNLGIDCTTVDILKEEGVTGSTVIDVTEDDLKELNIKMGPRKSIMQIIKSHKLQDERRGLRNSLSNLEQEFQEKLTDSQRAFNSKVQELDLVRKQYDEALQLNGSERNRQLQEETYRLICEHHNTLNKFQKEIEVKEYNFRRQTQKLVSNLQSLEHHNKKLHDTNLRNEDTIRELKSNVNFYEDEIKRLKENLQSFELKCKSLQSESTDKVSLIHQQEETVNDLQQELRSKEHSISKLNDKFESEEKLKVKMRIFVENSHTDKTFILEVEQSNTIQDIRNKIPKSMFWNDKGIPPDDHRLTFANKPLTDYQTLSECKIKEGSKLLLVWPLPSNMLIKVGIPNGNVIQLVVSMKCTVKNLKTTIQEKTEIPSCQQCLIFAGKILEDEYTLHDYDISQINSQGRSRIYLEMRQLKISCNCCNGMQIVVKTVSGECTTLEVTPDDTVKSLSAKYQEKEGVPSKLHRFFYCNRELEDGIKLSDYNIHDGSILKIVFRLLSCIQCPR